MGAHPDYGLGQPAQHDGSKTENHLTWEYNYLYYLVSSSNTYPSIIWGASLKVQFTQIPDEGLDLTIRDESWFPSDEISRSGPADARIFLEKRGKRVLLEGAINTTIVLHCDRCLDPFNLPLDVNFRADLELADDFKGTSVQNHVCERNEMDVIFLDEPVIDIFYVLRQQIFLSIPGKKLCSDSCKGLCNRCGANKNREKCGCPQDSGSSPFRILDKLKKTTI